MSEPYSSLGMRMGRKDPTRGSDALLQWLATALASGEDLVIVGSMNIGDLPQKAAMAAGQYLRRHPEELLRQLRCALSMKVGVPLPALRFLAEELGGGRLPPDLVIEARAPGIFVAGSIVLMNTPLSASATLLVERIDSSSDAILVELRVASLSLQVTDPDVQTPVAALLRSGALDVSRPGDLVNYMPQKPAILLEAKGDRFTLDLMRHPRLASEPTRTILAAVLPLLTVDGIQTADEHLDVSFSALPQGAGEAVARLRKLFGG